MIEFKKSQQALLIGFLLAAGFYALNNLLGHENIAINCIVKTLPVFFLSVVTWLSSRKSFSLLPFALYFSAIGDLAGELHLFIWQVAAFAIAQCTYAAFFFDRAKPDRKSFAFVSILIAISIGIGACILPYIDKLSEKIFVTGYIGFITLMAATTLIMETKRKWWYVLGAIVFMTSDTIIAVNRFVFDGDMPHETFLIMTTYFLAQFIFAQLFILDQKEDI